MNEVAELKSVGRKSLIYKVADRFGVDADKMLNTLKVTAFKQQGDKPITNEQMMALLVVADQYKLNPWTKELYAFPDKQNGIVPIVGLDGWSRLINDHPQFDGMDFEMSQEQTIVDKHAKSCPEWIKCVMYRKDRAHPIAVTEYLDEVYRPAFVKNKGQPGEYVVSGPWQSHTKRMLRHKTMIQCARIAFGYAGIYDQDEAERIVDSDITDVTYTEVEQEPPESGTEALKQKLKGKQPEAPIEASSDAEEAEMAAAGGQPEDSEAPVDDDWVKEYEASANEDVDSDK